MNHEQTAGKPKRDDSYSFENGGSFQKPGVDAPYAFENGKTFVEPPAGGSAPAPIRI